MRNNKDIAKFIREKVYEKVYEVYPSKELPKEIEERLELELNSIIENKFEDLYLVAHEVAIKSKKLGYPIITRGMIGNSLVAYLLEITEFNPFGYDLQFEFFAGKELFKEPDINLNISSAIKDKIVKYIKNKYGKDIIADKRNFDIKERNKVIVTNDDMTTMLSKLQEATKVDYTTIMLNDSKTLDLLCNTKDKKKNNSKLGIECFETELASNIIKVAKPKDFNDLVSIYGLIHGTDTWEHNAENIIKEKKAKLSETISNRDDIMNYLTEKGLKREIAFDIAEFIRKGKAAKTTSISMHRIKGENDKEKEELYENYRKKWEEYKEIMKKHDVPDWYIKSAEKISYLFPKAHIVDFTLHAFRIVWYKVHYEEVFNTINK